MARPERRRSVFRRRIARIVARIGTPESPHAVIDRSAHALSRLAGGIRRGLLAPLCLVAALSLYLAEPPNAHAQGGAGICDRTAQVRDAIVAAISGVDDCTDEPKANRPPPLASGVNPSTSD